MSEGKKIVIQCQGSGVKKSMHYMDIDITSKILLRFNILKSFKIRAHRLQIK